MTRFAWLVLALGIVSLTIIDGGYLVAISSYSASQIHDNNEAKHNQKRLDGPVLSVIIKTFDTVERLIERHEKLLIVLATIAIAWFTRTLWAATVELSNMAKQQAVDMRESLDIAKKSADSSVLQAKAAIAIQIPVVAMGLQKLCEFDSQGNNIRDPVTSGPVPDLCKPVFAFQNTGPTRILILYFAMKCEIAPNISGEPNFGGMTPLNLMLKQDEVYNFTTQDIFSISAEDRKKIDEGSATLWAYGFLIYNDFLDEGHQIGVCSKWDNKRGFVSVKRDNYSYHKHEKSYTKGFQI